MAVVMVTTAGPSSWAHTEFKVLATAVVCTVLDHMSPWKVSGLIVFCALAQQSQITEDFRALKKTAEDMNLFKTNHLFFFLLLSHIIVMESLAWFILSYFGTGWIPTLVTAFVLATSQVRPDIPEHHLNIPTSQIPPGCLLMLQ
jgi:hypothetical protein